jgi:ribosomal protein L25 (general stress protein Ctc)
MQKLSGQIGIFKAINHNEVTIKIYVENNQEIEITLDSKQFINALFGKLTKCEIEKLIEGEEIIKTIQ